MSRASIENFPIPKLSGGHYAGFILLANVHNEDSLLVSGRPSASTLDRETQLMRSHLLHATTEELDDAIAGQLRGTLKYSLRELISDGQINSTVVEDSEILVVQAYLDGPVQLAGIDLAKRLGWHRGESPENPFRDSELLVKAISAVESNLPTQR